MTADLILRSGRITTLDHSNPAATAVAITHGRFAAVGRDEDVMPLAGASTRIIDLKGRRALPGLIDNHLHIIRDATSLPRVKMPNRDNFFPEFPKLIPQRL